MSSTNTYTPFIFGQYVVYHITYSGDKFPPNYIGSTSLESTKNGYMGSVSSKKYKSLWKQELKENPHLFHLEIISYHDTRAAATYAELQTQKIFNVVKNPLFVNLSYAQLNGYSDMDRFGENHPNWGKKCSDETKIKMSISQKGRKHSDITKEKLSKASKGKLKTREAKNNMSKAQQGKVLSDETKNKMSKANSKRFEVWKDGVNFCISNLLRFCQENNLNPSSMYKVSNNKIKQHKGWICKKID